MPHGIALSRTKGRSLKTFYKDLGKKRWFTLGRNLVKILIFLHYPLVLEN